MFKITSFLVCFSLLLSAGKVLGQNHSGPWSLEECISYALSHNADVKQSALDLETSKAAQVQAKMSMLPTSRLGVNHANNAGRSIDPYTNQPVTAQFQSTDIGLNGNLTLFNGLQVQNTIRQNNLSLKASQQDLQQAQNTISLNVALAYLAVLQNEELLEIANRQVTTSKSQLERAQKLVNAGAMAQYTLADLTVQAGNDELERVNAENNLQTARLDLMQLMNLPATADFQVQKISVNNLTVNGYDKTAADVYATAEKVQPGIIGADLRVRSAQKGVSAARGSLYPSLSLFGYIGSNYSSAVPTSQFVADGTGYHVDKKTAATEITDDNKTAQFIEINGTKHPIVFEELRPNGKMQDFYYFDQLNFNMRKAYGVSLSVPILNSWQARNRISNAVIAKKRAEFLADNSRIRLRQNIEQAYTNLVAAQNRFETSRTQVEASEIAYVASQKRFENGSVHFVDLNLAKTNYDRAQFNLVRNKYDYLFRKKILDFYQNKPLILEE
jgi:outer membrane protein